VIFSEEIMMPGWLRKVASVLHDTFRKKYFVSQEIMRSWISY
jgi:hypothetical protein